MPNRFSALTTAESWSGLIQPRGLSADSLTATFIVSGANSRTCTEVEPMLVRWSSRPSRNNCTCQVPLGALSLGAKLALSKPCSLSLSFCRLATLPRGSVNSHSSGRPASGRFQSAARTIMPMLTVSPGR